ncbi:MAG TPA: hypothetical protein VHN59_08195 [Chitinophagaceae bacterium]|nr:hypothetical protein [Chitinophagaceae bacterium]
MKKAINQLTHALTGKEGIGECSENELRQMVRLYPFFGPAHLLLAKKVRTDRSEDASAVVQKASIYFSSPLWFDQLLNETGLTEQLVTEAVSGEIHDTILETPATEEEVVEQINSQDTIPVVPATVHSEEVIFEKPAETEDEQVAEQINEMSDEEETTTGNTEQPLILPSLKIEPLDESKMELTFEPYHTVDYFASQGIRFREEDKPKDRLGYQLKSFTEWLKTLKKLPPSQIPVTATRQEEKNVEQMAQVSITDREVVTEAMAEVWEKQGNAVKAQELYKKLSLLDPSKSSYFAAKIEHLKQL